MLHRQVVGVVAASGPVLRVINRSAAPHGSIDLRRLEQWSDASCVSVGVRGARRQLDEEEEFVENTETPATNVTTRVAAHVTKYRLDCVTICIAFSVIQKLTMQISSESSESHFFSANMSQAHRVYVTKIR